MGKSFVFAFTVSSADGFEVAEKDLKSFTVCLQKARFVFFKLLGTPVLFYYYLYIIIIFFHILNKLLFLAYMFSFHFILGFSTFMRFHFLYIGVFKASK